MLATIIILLVGTAFILWYRQRQSAVNALYQQEMRRRKEAERFRVLDYDTDQPLADPVMRVMETHRVVNLTRPARLVARNEEEHPIFESCAPMFDSEGNFMGAVIVFQDQSAQREHERQLRKSEQLHRNLIDGAPYAVFIQSEGRFAYVNQHCLQLFDADEPDDLLGREVLEHFDPACRDAVRERIRQSNEQQQPVNLAEENIVSRSGESIPVEIAAVPYSYQDKPGAIVFMHDIRQRKRAEADRSRNLAMLARTERIADIGSWEWEVATGEVTWSEELFRIFGLNPAEQAPRLSEHDALFTDEDFQKLQEVVERSVAEGTPYEVELNIIRKDGAVRHCIARGEPEMILSETTPDDPHYPDLKEIASAAERSAEITRQLLTFARKDTINPVPSTSMKPSTPH